MLTIGNLLSVGFPAIRNKLMRYAGHPTPQLAEMGANGRITITALGPVAIVDGREYEVQELSVPMSWTDQDDALSENEKINIACSLIENAFDNMECLLLEALGEDNSMVMSKEYRYALSGIHRDLHHDASFAYLRTAFALVPKKAPSGLSAENWD